MSSGEMKVQKSSVDNLRTSDVNTVAVLVPDLLRVHIDRIETIVVADLFAIVDAVPAGTLAEDLKSWAGRATREILDIPDGDARRAFLREVGSIPAASVPARLREAITALATTASAETLSAIDALAARWAAQAPNDVVLPVKKSRASAASLAGSGLPRKVVGAPKSRATARTPAADVDPRRGAFVREDVLGTLGHLERGIKESVLVAGIRHRSPFKDMTEAEVRSELRKLERERKLKKTGERWLVR